MEKTTVINGEEVSTKKLMFIGVTTYAVIAASIGVAVWSFTRREN